jgi:hypothetical protein
LPCVFEEHFHRKPGGSRNKTNKKGDGPCVRFIEATMRELGKPYSPASILRAMTRLRGLKDSRSRVRQNATRRSPLDKIEQQICFCPILKPPP